MPFDKAAHAAQLAGCVDHTGDELFFEGRSFHGNIGGTAPRGVPPLADLSARAALYLSAPRDDAAFAPAYPKAAGYIVDAAGKRYRILQDLSQPRMAIFLLAPPASA